jgi:4-hydroxy-2-oxoglutarate aldolase
MKLSGILPPLTTPFVDGKVAPERLKRNIELYETLGLSGYLVLGSTGEAAFIDAEERAALWKAARQAIPDGKPMIAGTGVESTSGTIRMTRIAADNGADYALVLTPFFFKNSMTGEALAAHYCAVADVSRIPIMLYNNPLATGVVIPPSTVGRLYAHENIIGLKDSSGDLGWLAEVLARVPEDFTVLSGHAFTLFAALSLGASGGILAVADAIPEPFVAVYNKFVAGDREAALEIQKAVIPPARIILGRHGVPGLKAAMDVRGFYGGPPRPPMLPADDEAKKEINDALEQMVDTGLLQAVEI